MDKSNQENIDSNPQPSSYADHPWLTHELPDKVKPEADGKWMFFFPGHVINRRWATAKELYNEGKLPGISSLKVSTASSSPNARIRTGGEHVLCFICGPSTDEESVMKIGRRLMDLFPTRSYFVYYKSDEQSLKSAAKERDGSSSASLSGSGTREKNYLYRLRRTPLTPIKMWTDGDGEAELAEPETVEEVRSSAKKDKSRNGSATKANGARKSKSPVKKSVISSTGNVFVFDTETTGFPPKADPSDFGEWSRCRMMEIAWHVYTPDAKVVTKSEYLIKPQFTFELHPRVLEVHGISKAKAEKEGVELDFALDELEKALEGVDVLVGHNVQFDVRVVLSEMARTQRWDLFERFDTLDTCCTMALGKEVMPVHNNQKLSVLYEDLFGHAPVGVLHRADTDVLACAEVYFRLKSMMEGNDDYDGKIMSADGKDHLEKNGKENDVLYPTGPEPVRFTVLQSLGLLVVVIGMFTGFWRMLVSSMQ